RSGDGAEELPGLTRADPDLDLRRAQLRRELLCLLPLAVLTGLTVASHRDRLTGQAVRRLHRKPARDQEVARVALRHVDDVTLAAELVDVGAKQHLHSSPPDSSATATTSSSMSISAPVSASSASPASFSSFRSRLSY